MQQQATRTHKSDLLLKSGDHAGRAFRRLSRPRLSRLSGNAGTCNDSLIMLITVKSDSRVRGGENTAHTHLFILELFIILYFLCLPRCHGFVDIEINEMKI